MANSSGPSLIDRIKSIGQGLASKAQTSARGKLQAGGTAQNGGGNQTVVDEADSLLLAEPPTGQWILFAFVILVLGSALSYGVWQWLKPGDFMPSSNYASYAGLFIMALAIERILEPFSGLFVPSTKAKKMRSRAATAHAKRVQEAVIGSQQPRAAAALPEGQAVQAAAVPPEGQAQQAVVARQVALPPTENPQLAAAQQAAVAQAELHHAQGARAVLMWATASVLAMLVCASLGVFLLRSVESPGPAKATAAATSASSQARGPNRLLDLLVTGLVVGAGTKPLHDLVSQIQTTSGTSKAKAASTTTS